MTTRLFGVQPTFPTALCSEGLPADAGVLPTHASTQNSHQSCWLAGLLPLGMVLGSTLYDMPVSNHGARVRFLIYKRGLEDLVSIKSPGELGGLRSEQYLSLSPQGKMPLLVDEASGFPVFESDAICRHLLDKHAGTGSATSLVPSDLTARTRSDMIVRLHDGYIGPIRVPVQAGSAIWELRHPQPPSTSSSVAQGRRGPL